MKKLVRESLNEKHTPKGKWDKGNYYPKNDPESDEDWAFQEGDRVTFDLKDMAMDWEAEDPEAFEVAEAHNGQTAIIVGQVTATEIGDKDYEYYDIEFEDCEYLLAVSGYHLSSNKGDDSDYYGDSDTYGGDTGERFVGESAKKKDKTLSAEEIHNLLNGSVYDKAEQKAKKFKGAQFTKEFNDYVRAHVSALKNEKRNIHKLFWSVEPQ
jgi:hypothetical protein